MTYRILVVLTGMSPDLIIVRYFMVCELHSDDFFSIIKLWFSWQLVVILTSLPMRNLHSPSLRKQLGGLGKVAAVQSHK